jgi:hypothetical protein
VFIFFVVPFSVKMAPKDKPLSSKLPEIMAQITQTLSESFEAMAATLFTRLQNQEKELVGEITNQVKGIKEEVEEVKKDIGEVKKEVIKSQSAPDPETKFEVPHVRDPKFFGRSEALGRLFGLWRPGKRGRIAVVGLGGIG